MGVFEALDFFSEVFGADRLAAELERFPRLRANHSATKALGGLRAWCEEERPRLFVSHADYAASVRATLNF